jgi:hypothetical protein
MGSNTEAEQCDADELHQHKTDPAQGAGYSRHHGAGGRLVA